MKSTAFRFTALFSLLMAGFVSSVKAQDKINVVTTAVPFLRISPDGRAGAMGELSLATSPDPSSSFFNLGKVPFNESSGGVTVTYTPWLKQLVNDVYLASVAGYYKIDENQAISGSLRYFNLGSIQFTDFNGNALQTSNPREFGFDMGYSRKLSEKFGIGVGLKYIYSNLASGYTGSGNTYKAGSSVAGDIGFYYRPLNDVGQGWAFGLALTNLGSKISYTDNAQQKDYIPANFGIGTTYTKVFDESNRLTLGVDLNKLMVPTPPLVSDPQNPTAQDTLNFNEYHNQSVVGSWFSSFSDAPGGFSEELKEFQVSFGAEYWYNNQFALRAGYFHENKTKGNRRYFTAGVGIKYNVFGLNFSYLAPSGDVNQNPLSNTLRFSLLFDLGGTKEGGNDQ
jgi:hypothetical protein